MIVTDRAKQIRCRAGEGLSVRVMAGTDGREVSARPKIPARRCIQSIALDILEGLVEATYTRNRVPALRAVNLKLEKLRLLFRLATDLQILDLRRYEHAARSIDEIGRLVEGEPCPRSSMTPCSRKLPASRRCTPQ